mgnify:FL=1
MGLVETFEGMAYSPQPELVQHIREELTEDFTSLLTEGGIVTANGTELSKPFESIADMLSPELIEAAESQCVIKLRRSQVQAPLDTLVQLDQFNRTRFYLFTRGAIDGLSYQEFRGGSIMPRFVNIDGSMTWPHSYNQHFAHFFAARTRLVMKHEDINGSYFRFAARILKAISNDKGLGPIEGKKAQDYIKERKKS